MNTESNIATAATIPEEILIISKPILKFILLVEDRVCWLKILEQNIETNNEYRGSYVLQEGRIGIIRNVRPMLHNTAIFLRGTSKEYDNTPSLLEFYTHEEAQAHFNMCMSALQEFAKQQYHRKLRKVDKDTYRI